MKSFVFILLVVTIVLYSFWSDLSIKCIKYGGINPYNHSVALRKTPNFSSKTTSHLKAKSFAELKESKSKWIYYYTLRNNVYVRKKDFTLGYIEICDGYIIMEEKLFLAYKKEVYQLLPFMIVILSAWLFILFSLTIIKKYSKPIKEKEKHEDIGISNNKSNFICPDCNRVSVSSTFCINCGDKKIYKQDESFYSKEYMEVANSKDGIFVALLTKVAKANGLVTAKEAQYLSDVFDKLCQHNSYPDVRNIFKNIHKIEKGKHNNIEKLCKKLLSFNISTLDKKNIISSLVELAFIDGINSEEENIIIKIVHFIGIEYTEYKKIVAHYKPKQNNNHSSGNTKELTLEQCYVILGCTEKDDLSTIKKHKNKLLQEYHPDKQGKDISEGMKYIAEEKTKEINAAYTKLKKYKSY